MKPFADLIEIGYLAERQVNNPMLDETRESPQRPYCLLAVFFGGFVSSVLPKDEFGEYSILWRALIVGVATAIAAVSIQWIQNRFSKS